MSYKIFTDSGSDIKPEKLAEWGVSSLPLSFRFDGEDGTYFDGVLPIKEFYDAITYGKESPISLESAQYALRILLASYESNDRRIKI